MSPPEGLMFVGAKAIDPAKTNNDLINNFYNDEHIPDLMSHNIQGSSKFALRYQNTNPDAKNPFLTLFPTETSSALVSEGAAKMVEATRQSKTLGGDIFSFFEFDMRPYEKLQTYEAYQQEHKGRGQTLISVAMEPGDDAELGEWYTKQHYDMLGMVKGFVRSTRWKRMDDGQPRFVALHEYDCRPEDVPADQVKQVVSSEWSKKVIKEAKAFDRDVWTLIHVAGDKDLRL